MFLELDRAKDGLACEFLLSRMIRERAGRVFTHRCASRIQQARVSFKSEAQADMPRRRLDPLVGRCQLRSHRRGVRLSASEMGVIEQGSERKRTVTVSHSICCRQRKEDYYSRDTIYRRA